MKPGYSRFDEGDLLAFYLVRQLTGAGFVPARVGGLVFDMLDEGDGYLLALEGQRLRLDGQRARISFQLAALGRLEVAASRSPEQRLEAIMESSLLASVDQSVVIAASERGRPPHRRQERAGCLPTPCGTSSPWCGDGSHARPRSRLPAI